MKTYTARYQNDKTGTIKTLEIHARSIEEAYEMALDQMALFAAMNPEQHTGWLEVCG